MNILKEIGIQQWQRRSARPAADLNLGVEQQTAAINAVDELVERPVNTNLRAALSSEPAVNSSTFVSNAQSNGTDEPFDSSFSDAPDDTSVGGFSGSLRQALDQSILKENTPNSTVSDDLKSALDEQKTESSSPLSATVAPINLAGLLIPEVESISGEILEVATELSMVDAPVMLESDSMGDMDGLLDDSIPVDRDLSTMDWSALQKMIETNEHCPSCGWGNGHLGSGDQSANWLFVVDAPNLREIEAQALFAGRAGQLFEAMLSALSLSRESVYCTSVFKCAPTDDLSITSQCDELLHRQIQLVSPQVVITFGEFAAQSVIKSNSPLAALRASKQHSFRSKTSVIPTYSPAEMLDDVSLKAQVWSDLKQALRLTSI